MNCIFCGIVAKEVPAGIRWQNDQWIAFDDIHPKAQTHVLVVPKKHIASLLDAGDADEALVAGALGAIREVARLLRLASYKVVSNNGTEAGQIVDHWHFHLLSGAIQDGV